jgi:hypothetical protein
MKWFKISEFREVANRGMNKKLIYGFIAIAGVLVTATVILVALNAPPANLDGTDGGGGPS